MAFVFERGDTLTQMKAKLCRTQSISVNCSLDQTIFVLPPVVDFHALKALMLPLETKYQDQATWAVHNFTFLQDLIQKLGRIIRSQ